MTISVGAAVVLGTYALAVTGTSGALSAGTTIGLTVTGPGPAAIFVGVDTVTQGGWTGKYGATGYLIANGSSFNPGYATVGFTGVLTYTWAGQTAEARALQSAPGAATGIASAYTQYAGQGFSINVGINDGGTHKVSLYLLDWDGFTRNQTITILDAATNTVLDTQTFSGFHNGVYAVWNLKGNVVVRVTPNGGGSPAVSGIFFQ